MDIAWACEELELFLERAELGEPERWHTFGPVANRASSSAIEEIAPVVERILDRVIPQWRTQIPDDRNKTVNRWCQHLEAARRAKALLEREDELNQKLGEQAPQLNAASLHPWIWDGARSLWNSGHYREAVSAAAIKLNAETQNKVQRLDISETDLFTQAFSESPPKPGQPRLRVHPDDGSKTFKSRHRGIRAFAEGCYAAIRNPSSHVIQDELIEHEALEQLAAFSVLARWVDDATLDTSSDTPADNNTWPPASGISGC